MRCVVAAPFGLKFCTRVFSLVLAEAHRPLYLLGHRGTSFIDDRVGVYSTKEQAYAREALILRLLIALGCYFSRKAPLCQGKCVRTWGSRMTPKA